MRVLNSGDWAREALQLKFEIEKEYQDWRDGLVHEKVRVAEIAYSNGSALTTHYLFVEGRQVQAHVIREEKLSDAEVPETGEQRNLRKAVEKIAA